MRAHSFAERKKVRGEEDKKLNKKKTFALYAEKKCLTLFGNWWFSGTVTRARVQWHNMFFCVYNFLLQYLNFGWVGSSFDSSSPFYWSSGSRFSSRLSLSRLLLPLFLISLVTSFILTCVQKIYTTHTQRGSFSHQLRWAVFRHRKWLEFEILWGNNPKHIRSPELGALTSWLEKLLGKA